MTQGNIPTELCKQVRTVVDDHPLYRSLGLDNNTACVKEALRVFIECNGECYRKVIREEIDRIMSGTNVSEKFESNRYLENQR
jgi:hypothetical protein